MKSTLYCTCNNDHRFACVDSPGTLGCNYAARTIAVKYFDIIEVQCNKRSYKIWINIHNKCTTFGDLGFSCHPRMPKSSSWHWLNLWQIYHQNITREWMGNRSALDPGSATALQPTITNYPEIDTNYLGNSWHTKSKTFCVHHIIQYTVHFNHR